MKKLLPLSLIILFFASSVYSQDLSTSQKRSLKSQTPTKMKVPLNLRPNNNLRTNQKKWMENVNAILGPSKNVRQLDIVPSIGAWPADEFTKQGEKWLRKPQPFHTMPVSFIPNIFDQSSDVKFMTLGLNGALLFMRQGLKFSQMIRDQENSTTGSLKLLFEGANSQVEITGEMLTEGKANFIIGNNESLWRTNVPIFNAVVYRKVYKGIDLYYVSDAGVQVKSEYHVKPGADPGRIRFMYSGVDSISLDRKGSLLIESKGGVIRQSTPLCYQEIEGQRTSVSCRYLIADRNKVSFSIGDYNKSKKLIIDPTIEYSTYFGSNSHESVEAIKANINRQIYIVGKGSNGFPTTVGAYNVGYPFHNSGVFVSKFDSTGKKLLYSTLITAPHSAIGAYDMAVDNYGHVYLTGYTNALHPNEADFPVKDAWDPTFDGDFDAFVLKLSPAGDQLIFSTYLGSTDQDFAYAIDLDSNGNVYVSGGTTSKNFPTTNGAYQGALKGPCDAFLSVFDANGKLTFSTLLGGSGGEKSTALAVDNDGNAYIAGWTKSQDFPTTSAVVGKQFNGAMDIFLTKLKANSKEVPSYSTYLGGSDQDFPEAIDIDKLGNTYITGWTFSNDFPTKNAISSSFSGGSCPPEWPVENSCPLDADAFVTALNENADGYIYSTYIGGEGYDTGHDITVEPNGTAYITGWTISKTFPLKDAIYSNPLGETDAFVTVLEKGGALKYSTFLGGSDYDYGRGIDIDGWGSSYVTGDTKSANFPVKNAYQSIYSHINDPQTAWFNEHYPAGLWDVFVTKIEFDKVMIKLPPKGSFGWLWTPNWWGNLNDISKKN